MTQAKKLWRRLLLFGVTLAAALTVVAGVPQAASAKTTTYIFDSSNVSKVTVKGKTLKIKGAPFSASTYKQLKKKKFIAAYITKKSGVVTEILFGV